MSFPTFAFFANFAACAAVMCICFLLLSSKSDEYVASHITKSEFLASALVFLHGKVSLIIVTFLPPTIFVALDGSTFLPFHTILLPFCSFPSKGPAGIPIFLIYLILIFLLFFSVKL